MKRLVVPVGILFALLLGLFVFARLGRLNWPGSIRLPLTSNSILRDPAWSPDGTLIAVISEDRSPLPWGTLIVVTVDGKTVEEADQHCDYFEPHWAPDGTHLTLVGCDGLVVSSWPDLTPTQELDGDYAEWSPSGLQLAVLQLGRLPLDLPTTLAITDLAGITATVPFSMMVAGQSFGGMAWSRATNLIALSYGSDAEDIRGGTDGDLYVISPDGSPPFRLTNSTPEDEFDPSWAPDGRWLVYLAGDGHYTNAVRTLVFTRADGTCSIRGLSHKQLTGVDWSPKGDKLAVTCSGQLYVVDVRAMLGHPYTEFDTMCSTPE